MKYKKLIFAGLFLVFFILLRIDSCMNENMLKQVKTDIKIETIKDLETEKPE